MQNFPLTSNQNGPNISKRISHYLIQVIPTAYVNDFRFEFYSLRQKEPKKIWPLSNAADPISPLGPQTFQSAPSTVLFCPKRQEQEDQDCDRPNDIATK